MDVDTDFSRPELLGIASAAVTVVAALLPWVRTSAPGPVDAGGTALGIEGMGLLTLLLGLVAAAAVLLLDRPDRAALAVGVSGVVVAVVAAWRLTDLGGVASPGIGLYLTLLAGLGLLAAGAWGYVADEQDEPATL